MARLVNNYPLNGNTYKVRFCENKYVIYSCDEVEKEIGVFRKVRGGFEGYLHNCLYTSERRPVKCRSIKDLVFWLDYYNRKNTE